MSSKLFTLGYQKLKYDTAVFICSYTDGLCIIASHVDNFHSFAPSLSELKKARKELHLVLEMMEEDPNWLMGFQLINDRKNGTVMISHTQYIETVLKRF